MTPRTPATPASDTVSEKRPAQLPCTLCWKEKEILQGSFRTHYNQHCKVLKDQSGPWVCAFTGISFDNKSEIIDWLRSWTHDRLVSVMMQDGSTSTVPAWVWITTYCEYAKERQRLAANPNTRSIAGALDQQITRRGLTMSRLPMVSTPSERQHHLQANTTANPGLANYTPQGQSQNHDVVDGNSRPQSAVNAGHSFNRTPGNPTVLSPPHAYVYSGNSSLQPPTDHGQGFRAALTYSTGPQPIANQHPESATPFDATITQPIFCQDPHGYGNLTSFNDINYPVTANANPQSFGWQPNCYINGNATMPPQSHIPNLVVQDHARASSQNTFSSAPQQTWEPRVPQTTPVYPPQQYQMPASSLCNNATYENRNFHSPQSGSQPPFAHPTGHQHETTRGNR